MKHRIDPSRPVSIVLCGAGGYGEWYLTRLLQEPEPQGFRLAAIVDPHPERCLRLNEIKERNIPLFSSLDDYFRQETCDLVVVASPIHLHCRQTCLALAHGSHVLCEKPLCVSLDEVKEMERAERASGKTVTVGYQWSFSQAVQRLKADFLSGRFGKARRLRTLVLWPRDERYYKRNSWAGRQYLDSGQPIFDSPVNNAAAHFLHNALYAFGPSVRESVFPRRVQAELWRANPIENYDTAALRIELEGGAELLFYASHANEYHEGPSFVYELEKGTVTYDSKQDQIVAAFTNGDRVNYGSPEAEPYQKLWNAIESARSGRLPLCGILAASAHAVCVNQAQAPAAGIRDFPPSLIRSEERYGSQWRRVLGLQEILGNSYQAGNPFKAVVTEMRKAFGSAD